MDKIKKVFEEMRNAVKSIEDLIKEAEESDKFPYRISKEIRKLAQQSKVAAQNLRADCSAYFKKNK